MEEKILDNNLEENTENRTIAMESRTAEEADRAKNAEFQTEETVERKIEEELENASEEELNKLKSWLFRENVRLMTAAKELEEMQIQFQKEKDEFQEDVKALKRKMSVERDRLKENTLFFEKKMDILKGGFEQLDMDRRRLEKERARFEAQREVYEQPTYAMGRDVSAFFKGVKNPLALKKRYKDLIKIFHPDNVAGDKEIIQMINKEYEVLKRDYDIGKWA